MSLMRAEWYHQYVHTVPHNPEDTLQTALSDNDIALIACGLELVDATYGCMREEVKDLQKRLEELISWQKFGGEMPDVE